MEYIVHTASPFPLQAPQDEEEVIRPAVDGTIAILKAARLNKVYRVVITSSTVAMMFNGKEG